MTDDEQELLERIGADFVREYQRDPGTAWNRLTLDLFRHLAVIANAPFVGNLRDIFAMARDVEEHIAKFTGKKPGSGETVLPLDEIGRAWKRMDNGDAQDD